MGFLGSACLPAVGVEEEDVDGVEGAAMPSRER